jgi:lipid II:glycine glycyltransferase (peptidoglycan interpeptide bridge formation enzyme)
MDVLDRFYRREDFHQSLSYAKVMEGIGWYTIPMGGAQIFVRQLGPVSLAKIQRPKCLDLKELGRIRKKLHIAHLIIEPPLKGELIDVNGRKHSFSFLTPQDSLLVEAKLYEAGYKITKDHFAHSKTALIDLANSLDTILAKFPSKTRYNIKISQRIICQYEVTRFADISDVELQEFFDLHTAWSKEKKVMGYTNAFLKVMARSFPQNGWLISARVDGKLAGAMMVIIHDRIGYYFYTCSSIDGRNLHIPTGLTYQAIKLSKEYGADIFDFCSVYDERYPKEHPRWKGFTTFKERFIPTPIYYPPSFDRWL